MGAAAIPLMIAGTASSAYSSYQEGLAEKNYYDYLAKNSRMEAGLVRKRGDQESTFAQDQGLRETKSLSRKVKQVEGAQTAAAAASGVAGSVTAQDIALDTFNKSKMDELNVRYNADQESWKAVNDASLKAFELENQARGYEYAGKAAKKTGIRRGFNSLLGGAGQVSSQWYMANKFGS